MKHFILLVLFMAVFNTSAFGACEDDPRLLEFPELLLSGESIGDRIYLSGSTFYRLRSDTRKRLGNVIIVCPAIPLNGNGIPMTKVRLPFADIWDALEWAVNAGDWEQVRLIADSAQALPMPVEGLLSLLSVPAWNKKIMNEMASIFRIQPGVGGWRFFVLDIFHALGGKAEKPQRVAWSSSEREIAKFRTRVNALKKDAPIFPYAGKYDKAATASLARVGIDFVEARNFDVNK